MLLCRQHPSDERHLFPIAGHIADLLRHDEVHFTEPMLSTLPKPAMLEQAEQLSLIEETDAME